MDGALASAVTKGAALPSAADAEEEEAEPLGALTLDAVRPASWPAARIRFACARPFKEAPIAALAAVFAPPPVATGVWSAVVVTTIAAATGLVGVAAAALCAAALVSACVPSSLSPEPAFFAGPAGVPGESWVPFALAASAAACAAVTLGFGSAAPLGGLLPSAAFAAGPVVPFVGEGVVFEGWLGGWLEGWFDNGFEGWLDAGVCVFEDGFEPADGLCCGGFVVPAPAPGPGPALPLLAS